MIFLPWRFLGFLTSSSQFSAFPFFVLCHKPSCEPFLSTSPLHALQVNADIGQANRMNIEASFEINKHAKFHTCRLHRDHFKGCGCKKFSAYIAFRQAFCYSTILFPASSSLLLYFVFVLYCSSEYCYHYYCYYYITSTVIATLLQKPIYISSALLALSS